MDRSSRTLKNLQQNAWFALTLLFKPMDNSFMGFFRDWIVFYLERFTAASSGHCSVAFLNLMIGRTFLFETFYFHR